jgi:caa(3)-type oxidase subunit IV
MAEENQIQVSQHDDSDHHAHSDEVVLPFLNQRFTIYGGMYTFIFGVLGVLTLIEAALTFLPENVFIIIVLVLLSLTKAYLVTMFYMHLNTDNKLFRWALIMPLAIVILSVAYLIFIPRLGGLGYF